MLYAAKCYWPGVSASEFEREAATRLRQGRAAGPTYLGSLVFGGDELVLCLYEGSSPAAVMAAARQARIPCERIMEPAWLPAADSRLSTSGGLP
jgi:hypothetical protein